jgi:predicted nucleotidyltransferase component of viral defense system
VEAGRLASWELLFTRALKLIDSVARLTLAVDHWSLGGGTVLMRRYRHRFSKDVDIFIPDPQYLNYLTPRPNDIAEAGTRDYIEQSNTLKLVYEEGEVDFIVAQALTSHPFVVETILDRPVQVETSAEIIAKKVRHRGPEFTARDVFDLACVIDKEPDALSPLADIFSQRSSAILRRMQTRERSLREDFAAIDVLEYAPSYDEAVGFILDFLKHFPTQ